MPAAAASLQKAIPQSKNPGRYDRIDLIFFTGAAIIIDLLLLWFDSTIVGVTFFTFIFLFKGVDTGFAKWLAMLLSLCYIPMTFAFVVLVYFMNTKLFKRQFAKTGKAGQLAQQAANASSGSAAGAAGAAGSGAAKSAASARPAASGGGASTATAERPGTKGAQPGGSGMPEARSGERAGAEGSPLVGQGDNSEIPYAQPPEEQQQGRVIDKFNARRRAQLEQERQQKASGESDSGRPRQETPYAQGSPLVEGKPYAADYEEGVSKTKESERKIVDTITKQKDQPDQQKKAA